MKNKIFLTLIMVLFCGKGFALPQDWPCEDFIVSSDDCNEDKICDFHGTQGDYELFLRSDFRGDCGSVGCSGTMKNLKTGASEDLHFDCFREDEKYKLKCYKIIVYEFYLRKHNDDEYRIIDNCGEDYSYVKLSECSGCSCSLTDSREENKPYALPVKCGLKDNLLECFTLGGYEDKHMSSLHADEDYENCVDLGGF